MSLIKSNAVQIGQSPTATQNFTLAVPSSPDGTIKLARGNAGATTQDVMNVSNAGVVSFPQGLGNISNSTAIATGSTTARSLANRFADVVNVLDFGAVGDGVADDTAAIQAAVALLNSDITKKCLFFEQGTYKITSSLTITRGDISIVGQQSTIDIVSNSQAGITIEEVPQFTRLQNITISNILINSSVSRLNSASGIKLFSVENVLLENVTISNQGIGLNVNFYEYIKVSNCNFLFNETGCEIGFGDGVLFSNIRMNAWNTPGAYKPGTIGVKIISGGGFTFSNTDITRMEWGIACIPDTNITNIGYLFLSTTLLDTCNVGLYANASAGGEIRHIKSDGSCWFGSNESHGIYLNKVDVTNISGSVVLLNGNHGIHIENCREVYLTGVDIAFNNKNNNPFGSGVFVKNTTGLDVRSCSFLNQAGFYNIGAYNQKHGLYLDIGVDGYTILDNKFNGSILDDIKIISTPIQNCNITNNRTTKSPTIASSSSINPEIVFDKIFLTGNTTVTNILTPKVPFKELTIITTGSITITKGGNFALASNYVATNPYSTLTLISNNGTSWSEKSRAII